MTKTDTRDIRKTVRQIRRLEEAGCEIVRVAVVDEEAARAITEIKKRIKIPLIADIHFHPHLALMAMGSGADGLRINPGNIGGRDLEGQLPRRWFQVPFGRSNGWTTSAFIWSKFL
jgi:(E)-4-hydroxy-3-methylbut-2-enyl-diphosphate synthase